MQGEVELRYIRDGETYVGNLQLKGAERSIFEEFKHWSFKEMMIKVSKLLNMEPDARLTFIRLESPSLQPFSMDQKTIDLLRRDPLMAVKLLDPLPAVIDLRTESKKRKEKWGGRKAKQHSVEYTKPPIRAGYDTLADAFGEDLYIRHKDGKYESPITGRWEWPGQIGVWTVAVNDRWGKVPVVELLAEKKERYYLPRAWNTPGPWISIDDLEKKLEQYLEEKRCSEAAKH